MDPSQQFLTNERTGKVHNASLARGDVVVLTKLLPKPFGVARPTHSGLDAGAEVLQKVNYNSCTTYYYKTNT